MALAAAHGKIHRSSGTPSSRATSALMRISAQPWSTWMFAFISFVYGKVTWRLSAEAVRSSSGVYARGVHAASCSAATVLKPAHSSAIRWRCSAGDRPAATRRAFSISG